MLAFCSDKVPRGGSVHNTRWQVHKIALHRFVVDGSFPVCGREFLASSLYIIGARHVRLQRPLCFLANNSL